MSSERPVIDDLDWRLAQRLSVDGRESNRSLAAALNVNQATIAARLRRMAAANIMRVVAVTDITAFGFEYFAFGLVDVADRPATDVAEDLAAIPGLVSVNVVTGGCDIVVRVIAYDRQQLARIFGEEIEAVEGVRDVRCEWAVDIVHYTPRYAQLGRASENLPPLPLPPTLDETDGQVIEILRRDARTSNRSVAASLGVSEGTVRNRIRRLQDEGFIRIQAVCDYDAFGLARGAFVGVKVSGGRIQEVGRELADLEEVQIVMRTIGTYEFLLLIFSRSRADFLETLHSRIARIGGVAATRTFAIDSVAKHVYSWTQVR
jgi:DNA-binding Lrp family transcriptional regulator